MPAAPPDTADGSGSVAPDAAPDAARDAAPAGAGDAPTAAAEPPVLAVDLDGTLLRSDMLHESFWSAFSGDWRTPVTAALALRQGRAALKRTLAEAAGIDPATLPYDPQVIARIEAWRRAGGRTALVTAADQRLAEAVAAHLGLFDEVHGSDGRRNLKGPHKGAFLEQRFGLRGFAYMGDAAADLPVWRRAGRAITVNAGPVLRRQAEAACAQTEHLDTAPRGLGPWLQGLRPHQWVKNLLVFLPMLAAQQFDGATVLLSVLAFVCFSMVASSVYLLNDLLDLGADRAHPRKRHRPLAAGRIPIARGAVLSLALLGLGLGLALAIGPGFAAVMAGYVLLTTAYSLDLKRRTVLDICVLAGLYTIRILAGGIATGIPLSVWLLAFAVFFFLALAAVKRQAELIDSAERGKLTARGRGYHVDDLPVISMIAIAAGYVAVLVMTLYVNTPMVVALYSHPEALWGVSAVLLYWITRTVMLTHRGQMHDDPVVYALRDRTSQLCLALCLGFVLLGALG